MYTVAAALRAETVVYVENLWAPGGVRHTSQEAKEPVSVVPIIMSHVYNKNFGIDDHR